MGKEKKRSVKASRKAQIKAMRLKGQESLRRKREEMANYKAQKSAFSEIDEDQTGGVSESKLDNLFKSCRRELPGYELRKIIDSRENHNEPISLNEFAQFYIDQRSHDYSNKFKASIKVIEVLR